jgi:Peptidase_C39 like family
MTALCPLRSRRAWLLGAGAVALSGCAVFADPPQTAALAAAPPPGLAQRIELREVPFFPQTPYHCGPAALATALVHAGLPATPQTLADAVFLPARDGTLQTEMLAAARRAGGVAVPLPPQLVALLREVAAGHAVIVLQNLGLSFAPRWHYAVVVGYDLAAREVVMRSGTTEREPMGFVLFERTWARSGHWAFTALPPGQLPVTAREGDALQAAIGFERVAPPAQALRAYDSVVARWPANELAGLGQGNTSFASGDLDGAAVAFERVARQHDSAAAWHNLAIARARLGQREPALAAAARALARARTVEPAWLEAAERLSRELQTPQ